MKSIFSRTTIVALALWLGLAAGSANAIPVVTLTGSNATGYVGTFGAAVTGVFNHIYSFAMPVDSSGGGSSNSIALDNNGSFSYSAFNLYSTYNAVTNTLGGLISTGTFSTVTFPFVGSFDVAALKFSSLATPATYYLNVIGSATNAASYSGNINISPVPEAETYAMLLAGLGLIGFSVRRRKTETNY